MEIGPVNSNQPRPTGAENEKSNKGSTQTAKPLADSVEISNEARMKLAALADKARRETLGAQNQEGLQAAEASQKKDSARQKSVTGSDDKKGKLEQVRLRIKSGFYNQPEVKKEIAERLTEELQKRSEKQQ